MSEIKRLLNALLWEIYGRVPSTILRRHRRSELMKMHSRLYEPRLLAKLNTKVIGDICDILQLEIRLMSKYLERVLISRDKNRTQQTILYGFLGVIVSSRLGESSREMRFTLSPPPGAVKGRGESGRIATVEESTSSSDFSQWLHAMKMVARLPGGMPPEFRRKLWLALAEKYLKSKNVDWKKEEEKCFSEQWREDDEELGIQIVKDLHRTGSSLCSGPAGTINQAKLKRILLGYARYNPEVGYCQGFNMLGALILQVMDKEEIESIKVMIYLVEGILPRGYFSGSLGGLQADMAVFRDLMTSKLPRLAKHLQKLQGPVENAFEPPLTNVFTMQWFLTMFCTCLPMTCVLRVWDLVLIEGSDVLLRTALVLWSLLEERILCAKTADDFYCKMGSFSSELLNGHLIDSNGLIEKVVELGPVPDLQKMRDKHLYNISPFRDKKGLQLYYSDEEGDSDEDSQMAVATAWGLRLSRRGSAGLNTKTDGKERIALDISLLKKQYDRLRERQRQAHIILTSAVARQGSNPNQSSIQMNQLLIGRNAIVTNNGRRLGPPQGAIPPARKPSLPTTAKSSKLLQSKPLRRGETLHWRDTELSKRRRGSVKWKDIKPNGSQQGSQDDRTSQLIDSAPSSRSSSSEPKSQRNSFKTHQRSDSSSYSEDSDGNSSTSTSLCDEDDHDNNISSLEGSPLKKSKSSKKHSEGSHKKSLDEREKPHTTHIDSQIPFVQLTTVGSPLLSANKTEMDALDYGKEDSETESNRLGYAGFVDEYSWPDINEPAKSAPLEDLQIDVTAHDTTDYLSLPTTITSISQLSPIADISTYIQSSSISPLRTPISAFDYSNLVGSTDDPKDFNVNDEGVTNEYFERINIVERPTKLDLLYSLNEEDSIRNAFKSCEPSPEESVTNADVKLPLDRTKHVTKGSDDTTTHPFTEDVDRKMKVLLEYSNQSSLSFIAQAKHEISSGLFKDKEFEPNSLKTLTVPYARGKDTLDGSRDLTFSFSKVDSKVTDEELSSFYSGKDYKDERDRYEIPKVNVSETGVSQDLLKNALAPNNTQSETELDVSTLSGQGLETELRKSLKEEGENAFSIRKVDINKIEADFGSLHIPTTENLKTRFKALELTFVDRKINKMDTTHFKSKGVEKDLPPQIPSSHHDKSHSKPTGLHTEELKEHPSDSGVSPGIHLPDDRTNFQTRSEYKSVLTELSEVENFNKMPDAVGDLEEKPSSRSDYKHSFPLETSKADHSEANNENILNPDEYFSFGQEKCSVTVHDVKTGQEQKSEDIPDSEPSMDERKGLSISEKMSVFNPDEYLSYGQERCKDEESSATVQDMKTGQERISVNITNRESSMSISDESSVFNPDEYLSFGSKQCKDEERSATDQQEPIKISVDIPEREAFMDLSVSGKMATFNPDECLPFGHEQCRDEERSATDQQDRTHQPEPIKISVDIPNREPCVEEEADLSTSFCVDGKASEESEKDLIGFKDSSYNTESAYSFVPTLDVQSPDAASSEGTLMSSSFTEKQFAGQEAIEQENLDVTKQPEGGKQTNEANRSSDFGEIVKAPVVFETKPVFDFKKIDSEKSDSSYGDERVQAESGPTRKSKIPSTEDLETRFMALERQFSDKSISLQKDSSDSPDSKLKSPIKEQAAAENANDSSAKSTIEISVTENISLNDEDETGGKKVIPSTAALEQRYEQLERKLSEHSLSAPNTNQPEVSTKLKILPDNENQTPKSPNEKLSEPPYVRKRIPSTEDLENRFKALEMQKAMKSPTATTASLLSPLGSSKSLPFPKDDSSNVPSTETLESRFKALETSKQLESASKDDAVSLSGIPSTRDLESRFDALEQQKLVNEQKLKVRETRNELVCDSNPTAYSGLEEDAGPRIHVRRDDDVGAGKMSKSVPINFKPREEIIEQTKKLPSTHDLELRFDAFERAKHSKELQGSSNNLELKSSKDIMNESKKLIKHIPSTQDLETRFKILEGSKPLQADDNQGEKPKADEIAPKRPLSRHFEVEFESTQIDESRIFRDPPAINAKDLQIMKYKPTASQIDRNQKDPLQEDHLNNEHTPEIRISFKRRDLYKVESQSDETLAATDPTSTEFETKLESRPTSWPEYNDTIDTNTVNTDRVLKIIEENSKILHRILKKTLADAGNIETNTQHKITDSLLALGNIFPRSDETIPPSGTKSHSSYRSCITLHSDDNISDRLASIKSTIKSIDTLCEEKSFRKDKCQRYIDSLFAHSKISTTIPLNPAIRVEDFEANAAQSRVSKRELKKDISPRRRRDEEREEYESRVRRDTMPNSLDPSSELSCSVASFDVDKEVDRINQEKTLERPLSPYYGSGYELNKRSLTPVVYIPTKLEIRHTTVTSTFYDRYLTEKEIERTSPKNKKSPVSPTVTKSYLDISKYSSINLNDRNSKSAENSPSRRKDAGDLFLYDKSPSANKKLNLTSTLGVAQNDLHIQSCDNILLRLQSATHHKDVEPPLLVYNPLQRKPPDLGISLGLYKDYGSDESTKS